MHIVCRDEAFGVSASSGEAVCELLHRSVSKTEVIPTVEQKTDTLFYLRRSLKNIATHSHTVRIAQRVKPLFDVKKYLIPCVNINGNEFGAGFEPNGLERDGKRWGFAHDRVSIPACTLTENADMAVALFVSAEDALSLESFCSIYRDEQGSLGQELSHPGAELPFTYSDRNRYSDGYETFFSLSPGETVVIGAYLSVSKLRHL